MSASNDAVKFYNKSHLTESSRKGYYPEKLSFILHNLKEYARSQKTILDVACNDGELSKVYTKYGNVIGIDINKQAVALCKKKGIKCFCTDLKGITKKYKNYFDVVIAGDIIEHIFDTDDFLHDIYTVLKPGGIVLLTTPNIASLARRGMLFLGKSPFIEYSTMLPNKEFNVGHIRYYTVQNMYEQLNSQRFKQVRIYGDKINIFPFLSIPYLIAKFMPTVARNMMVYAEK